MIYLYCFIVQNILFYCLLMQKYDHSERSLVMNSEFLEK